VFEELRGDVLVCGILPSQLQRDRQHIAALYAHPGGGIRLLEITAHRDRGAAVEDTDVVQSETPLCKMFLPSASLWTYGREAGTGRHRQIAYDVLTSRPVKNG
jgi:hypothetical protein